MSDDRRSVEFEFHISYTAILLLVIFFGLRACEKNEDLERQKELLKFQQTIENKAKDSN